MSRNLFDIIFRMLHFNDNSEALNTERLFRITPLLCAFENNLQTVYILGPEIVIDETLAPWRGRFLFKQYISRKKHKFGIKFFNICNSKGFTWKIKFYSGKFGNMQTGLGEKAVM